MRWPRRWPDIYASSRTRCVSGAGPRPGPAAHASVAVEFAVPVRTHRVVGDYRRRSRALGRRDSPRFPGSYSRALLALDPCSAFSAISIWRAAPRGGHGIRAKDPPVIDWRERSSQGLITGGEISGRLRATCGKPVPRRTSQRPQSGGNLASFTPRYEDSFGGVKPEPEGLRTGNGSP